MQHNNVEENLSTEIKELRTLNFSGTCENQITKEENDISSGCEDPFRSAARPVQPLDFTSWSQDISEVEQTLQDFLHHHNEFGFKPEEPVYPPPYESVQKLEQQGVLQDLAMMQAKLVRKEEEIDRLKMEFEKANSDQSKVYNENLGEIKQLEQNVSELEKMLTTKNEEVMRLKTKLDETGEIVQGFACAMSEKISSLVTVVCDSSDLETTSKKLEGVRSELLDLAVKLGAAIDLLVEAKEEELEFRKENLFDFAEPDTTDTPIIMLEMLHLEKQHRLSKRLLETSGESQEYIEQRFLMDLALKNEVLEEEIARLTLVTRL